MEILSVLAICFLVLALNCLPFIIGSLATPANSVYLGTVHWAGDYFSYLSQMAQGKYSFFLSRALQTAEKLPETIVGWQMVLLGKVFALLGIDIIYGYQIAVVVFILLFLILAYRLIIFVFPQEKGKRLITFFFFATSTAFFKVAVEKGKLAWSIYDYWYNTGNALTRFVQTPHHAIANTLAVSMMLITVYWIKNKLSLAKQIILMIASAIAGAALCGITPIHWGLVGGGAGIATVAYQIISALRPGYSHPRQPLLYCKKTIWLLLPVFFFVLSGIPVMLYLQNIVQSIEMYAQASSWEGGQQLPASFYLILVGSGLVVPLSFLGVYNFFKKVNFSRVLGVSFILFCALFFFTPIPANLHLTNARFWPATVYIFIAALAAEGVYFLANFFGKHKRYALAIFLLVYVISIVPTYIIGLSESAKPKLGNAYYYLPKEIYESFLVAEKISPTDSLFLVQWPMNLSFPGITGRRTFHGYALATMDYATKDREAYDFFAGNLSEEQMGALLDKYGVDYVLGYWWNPKLDKFGRLKRVYSNPVMAIDEVMPNIVK